MTIPFVTSRQPAGRGQGVFSFVPLTTVGYGDVLPMTGQASALALVEAVMYGRS